MSQTIPPTINPAPTPAPQRGDRTTFKDRVDAFITWLIAAVAQFGAVATNVYNNAVDAFNSASASASSASAAAQSVLDAQNAAATAAQNANATKWVSGTSYAQGAVVWSPADFRTYRRRVAGAGTTDPSADSANWAANGVAKMPRQSRTSNTMLVGGDHGTLIELSGAFTQTLDAAATIGAGWYVVLRNGGNSDITLDPNGAETIDAVTSGVMKPGMSLLVQCDGVGFNVLRLDQQTIVEYKTSGTSGVWPLGVRRAKLRMGGGGASGNNSAGGGAGAYLEKVISVNPGTSYTYSIGAAGPGPTNSTAGVSGGSTTLTYNGVTYTASGGTAPNQFSTNPGGTATNGDINVQGGSGEYLSSGQTIIKGGDSLLGIGGGVGESGRGFSAGGGPSSSTSVPAGSGAPGLITLEY